MLESRQVLLRPVRKILLTLLAVFALTSAADAQDFETRLDCDGSFAPGEVVGLEIEVENMTNDDIPVDAVISIDVPGIGVIDLLAGAFTLTAGQQYVNANRSILLPDSAPIADDYVVQIAVDSETLMTFDTCDFDVQ